MRLNKLHTTKKAAEAGTFMQLRDPVTDAPLVDEESGKPIGLTLLGSDSDAYRKAKFEIQDRRTGRVRVKSGGRVQGLVAEQQAREDQELIARMCTGVHGLEDDAGSPIVAQREAVMALFERIPCTFEQADAHVHDREHYKGE